MSRTANNLRIQRLGRQTKLQETCGRLAQLAQELGPEAKLPTVLELRDSLGVSVATLNSALGELEAQRIIRRKHGVGIYVSPRIRQHNVVLLCDPSFFRISGASPFWSLLVENVRQRAEEYQESVSFHFTADALHAPADALPEEMLQEGLAADLAAGRIHGILAVGVLQRIADWLELQQVPMVAFAGPAPYFVGLDSAALIRGAVAELAALGCRRIGFWAPVAPYRLSGDDEQPTALTEAHRTFRDALLERGLPFDPALVRENRHLIKPGSYHTEPHQEQGYRTALEAFGPSADPDRRPDGIVSNDDMLTQGALTALGKAGVVVGRDVHLASHANAGSPALLGWEEELTLMQIDPSEIVRHMFDTLERLMDGVTPPERTMLVLPRLHRPKRRETRAV
ncbi:MAG TPA: substrate-binding domain-containing protein [Armatimonadaceae bacterium]|nr:substrate-binding domain-containing protein [Armatimonadaceae bacterium]